MRKVSVGILTLAGAAVLLISFLSANLGYTGSYDIGPAKIGEIAEWRPEVATAMRAIRGTSAAYAAAFAALFLSVVLGPYRRGEVWAWWSLFGSLALLVAIVAARIPVLGTQAGVGPALTLAGLATLGLLFDVGRLKGK